jgi:hypothetical protein
VKLMLTCASVFLIALAAGLAVLFGDHYELAGDVRTSAVAGLVDKAAASRAYDSLTASPAASTMPPPGRGATVMTPMPLSQTIDATEGTTGTPLAGAAARLEEEVEAYRASLAAILEKFSQSASRDGRTDE